MAKKQTLEKSFEQLEAMIKKLEEPEITLEDSFKTYQEGMKILKQCNDEIDEVEKKVLVINEAGETDEF